MSEFSNRKVLVAPPKSWEQVEAEARHFLYKVCQSCLKQSQPTPILFAMEFGTLKELYGIDYGVEEMTDSEAKYVPVEEEIVLSAETYSRLEANEGRARFTLAHEIGHALLHGKYIRQVTTRNKRGLKLKRSEVPPYQSFDKQADIFASEVLLPSNHISKMLKNDFSLNDVAEIFKVSIEAANVKMDRVARKSRG